MGRGGADGEGAVIADERLAELREKADKAFPLGVVAVTPIELIVLLESYKDAREAGKGGKG